METLAYLHHSTAFENPEGYEVSFDWDQVNLLDSAAVSKLSTKGAMYLLAATCGLGVAVAAEEAQAVLFPGDSGPEVATLQRALLQAGYDVPGAVTTFYGPSTTAAVERLQANCGISVDGIFGPDTEQCLYGGTPPVGGTGLLSFGSTGPDVTAWQVALLNAGYSVPGAPSGFFGSSTDAATRELQRRCGVAVDGVVGPQTRACLSGPVGGPDILFPGQSGQAVFELQRALIAEAWLSPGLDTGFYGPLTEDAVRRLQRSCGVAVDGIFGPRTRSCLGAVL